MSWVGLLHLQAIWQEVMIQSIRSSPIWRPAIVGHG